ncbi:MAG TPA: hypothetical protein VLE94_06700 [Burkholderiaceae bacterium]|nr:hypothetical protein [Burkholderiaceae bacterium]
MNPDDDVSNAIRRDVLRVAAVAAIGAFAAAWLTLAARSMCPTAPRQPVRTPGVAA